MTAGFFFVEKIELNVIAAGFGIFSSNEFYSSNGKALGWLVFLQLDLERGGSNDVATTDDVCSISRKVKLILWLFAIKWHLHSSEHRRLLVLSHFSLLTLRPVDRSSSPVFNVRPWLYTTMIRTYVLKHRQFASCLYYYLQTSTLLEEYWCAFVCVCVCVCIEARYKVLSTARSKSLFHYGKHAREPQIIEYTFPTQQSALRSQSTCVNIHRNRTHNISDAGQSRNPRRWSWQKAIYLIKKKVKALLLPLFLFSWHNLWSLSHVLPVESS